MKIVDYIPDSIQEYKSEHSLVLFCQGCDLNCDGCYNYDIVNQQNFMGFAKDMIDKHITDLHTAVVFLGGEPTIWTFELLDALRQTKSKGLKTKVFSNGMNSDIIRVCSPYVDAWSFDFKAVENVSDVIGVEIADSAYIDRVERSIKYAMIHTHDVESRTTLFNDVVRNQIDRIKKRVGALGIRHIIQDKFTGGKNEAV